MRIRPLITGFFLAAIMIVCQLFWLNARQNPTEKRAPVDLLVLFPDSIERQGQLVIQLYDHPTAFALRTGAIDECLLKLELCDEIAWRFSDLPPGEYAVAVFHDRNENGRWDRGPRQRPGPGTETGKNRKDADPDSTQAEPTGFSNFDASDIFDYPVNGPTFDQCRIQLDQDRTIRIRLGQVTTSGAESASKRP